MSGTVPGCPGGSASEGPVLWEVSGFWPPDPMLQPPPLSYLSLPCPTLSHWQGPLGWGGQGRAGLSTRQQRGVIIAPSRAGVGVKPAFLSGPQALC